MAFYCIQFDGTDDYVDIGNISILNFSPSASYSISCWVNSGVSTGEHPIYSKSGSIVVAVYGYKLGIVSGKLTFKVSDSFGAFFQRAGGTTITDSAWHNVVVTYSGTGAASGAKLYVDGVEESYTDSSGGGALNGSTNSTSVQIARTTTPPGTTAIFLTGYVDDVRVYTRVLSSSEAVVLAACGDPSSSNLVGWWKFDDGTGTTAVDSSGNGNNGTLTNGPTWQTTVPTCFVSDTYLFKETGDEIQQETFAGILLE